MWPPAAIWRRPARLAIAVSSPAGMVSNQPSRTMRLPAGPSPRSRRGRLGRQPARPSMIRVLVWLRHGGRDEGGGGGGVPEFFKPVPGWQQDDREDHADSEQRR
jgi:hypothetical protein